VVAVGGSHGGREWASWWPQFGLIVAMVVPHGDCNLAS